MTSNLCSGLIRFLAMKFFEYFCDGGGLLFRKRQAQTTRILINLSFLAIIAVLVLDAHPAQAGNLLVNPGFETAPYGQVVPVAWSYFAPPTLGAGVQDYWVVGPKDYGVSAHSGTYFWKQWNALYSTPPTNNVAGIYQAFPSAPGDIYQASGWMATSSLDSGGLGAGCVTWIQVEFLNASSNLIALYKSPVFSASAGLNNWLFYSVTNACNLSSPVPTGDPFFTTYAVTGSVTQMVAPAGTTAVRYRYAYLSAATNESGSAYLDDAVLNQINGPIAAPTGLVIQSGDQSVLLHWNPNVETYVSGYNVYRSLSSSGPFVVQNGSPLTAPGFCDLNVSDGQTYYYEVTALTTTSQESPPSPVISAVPNPFASDAAFLDYLQQANFDYFWYEANPANGLIPDRTATYSACSIAAEGFGLTAIGIGIDHGWITRTQGAKRVLTALNTFYQGPQGTNDTGMIGYNGWFYHFLDMNSATRSPNSEVSSVDTVWLLSGILYAKQYFNGTNSDETGIRTLADEIFNRVNWPWINRGGGAIAMGWLPESGFTTFGTWVGYNEGMMIYLLGMGAATNPIPASGWSYWTSGYSWATYYGQSFVPFGPLFGHEYSHCWVDFRHIADAYMNDHSSTYFENSRRATIAQQEYCIADPSGWSGYGSNVWGLTACDDPNVGYEAHGAPPAMNDDGTLAPTASGGAMGFAPDYALPTLEYLYNNYRTNLWTANGFRDAFNPSLSWYDTDELGIDQGPIVIMIENYRNQHPWQLFMQNPEIQRGLQQAGFVSLPFVALTAQVSPNLNAVTVSWKSQVGRTYQVEYSPDLTAWFASPSGEVTAGGSMVNWTDSGPPGTATPPFGANQRFYRVFQFGSP
jgi:hypothetical protein